MNGKLQKDGVLQPSPITKITVGDYVSKYKLYSKKVDAEDLLEYMRQTMPVLPAWTGSNCTIDTTEADETIKQQQEQQCSKDRISEVATSKDDSKRKQVDGDESAVAKERIEESSNVEARSQKQSNEQLKR